MNRRDFVSVLALGSAWPLAVRAGAQNPPALPPLPAAGADGWVSLFNGRNLDGWYTFLQASGKNKDPQGHVRVENGMLHVLGHQETAAAEPGYIATTREYANYHLRIEYRFGERRFAPRSLAKRDNGLLYHVVGEDRVWPTCMEFQIQETDTGDAIAVSGTQFVSTPGQAGLPTWPNEPGTGRAAGVAAGAPAPAVPAAPAGGGGAAGAGAAAGGGGNVTLLGAGAPAAAGRRWPKNGDFEKLDDWNVLDLIAIGDKAAHLVNGRIVNSVFRLKRQDPADAAQFLRLDRGKIALEVEYAETIFRSIKIRDASPGA